MSGKIGFDREKYIEMQSEHILERRAQIGGKLYLEMGGKLFDDNHASRVLPGFTPDNKIVMLEKIAPEIEIIVCLNARDLQRQKMRSDVGITYDEDVLRLIDIFRERGFLVENVVMTQFEESNTLAVNFMQRLERMGVRVARHRIIPGYPSNVDLIASEEGLGKNDYVHTTRDLIVVTAPGPGSGKLATCLSQIYHESKRGVKAGYAKFETFPIWNVPLEHPVNLAYEAATVDLDDANLIDPFHLKAYGESVSSYNRDIDVFPLVHKLLERIAGKSPYQSPTDMGVNMAGYCICDDDVVREASRQEIIRRYYQALVEERKEALDTTLSDRVRHVMRKAGVTTADRKVVAPAIHLAEETGAPAAAMELADGTIITGKTSELLGCSAAMLLNALKYLAGIDPEVLLLSPQAIEPIQHLKTEHFGSRNPRLHTDEVLIALSVSASTSQDARNAMAQLSQVRATNAHVTTILGSVDEMIFRNLGVFVTTEPKFQRKSLYQKK